MAKSSAFSSPVVRGWCERVRVSFKSDKPSLTDPSFAVDQDAESIVKRFSRLGDSALASMKAREASGAGLYGDVTAFQETSSAAMYIKSRDKIKEAAVEVAKKRSKRVADGEAALRRVAEIDAAAAAAAAAGSPGAGSAPGAVPAPGASS